MIYIVPEVYFFTQLKKINPELVSRLLSGFQEQMDQTESIQITSDGFLYPLGETIRFNPIHLAEKAIGLLHFLKDHEDQLSGFRVSVFSTEKNDIDAVMESIRQRLLTSLHDHGLWVDDETYIFLKDQFVFKKHETMWMVQDEVTLPKWNSETSGGPLIGVRAELVNHVLDRISPRLNGDVNAPLVALSGKSGTGRREAVSEATKRVLGEKSDVAPVRLFTLFKRQSAIHPFLNSVDLSFMDRLPQYLSRSLAKVWSEKSNLLYYLKNKKPGYYCFDRLFQDFSIVYHLYLSAYLTMAEKNLVPLFFICEDVELYQSKCLQYSIQHSFFH